MYMLGLITNIVNKTEKSDTLFMWDHEKTISIRDRE
jgi:hypothetical protein